MNFPQYGWIVWGGAVAIIVIVCLVWYGWPGGETLPAQ